MVIPVSADTVLDFAQIVCPSNPPRNPVTTPPEVLV